MFSENNLTPDDRDLLSAAILANAKAILVSVPEEAVRRSVVQMPSTYHQAGKVTTPAGSQQLVTVELLAQILHEHELKYEARAQEFFKTQMEANQLMLERTLKSVFDNLNHTQPIGVDEPFQRFIKDQIEPQTSGVSQSATS